MLPSWWALWLLWWPLADAAMFQCVYGYLQSVFFFLVLFHCCILLEIKLTTTTTTSMLQGLIVLMDTSLMTSWGSPLCLFSCKQGFLIEVIFHGFWYLWDTQNKIMTIFVVRIVLADALIALSPLCARTSVASFTKEVNLRIAKCPLVFNGRFIIAG